MNIRSLLIFFFILSSCTNNAQNDINRVEEKIDLLIFHQNEISHLSEQFDSNEYDPESTYRVGEQEYQNIKEFFYKIDNHVLEIEKILTIELIDNEFNHIKLFFEDDDEWFSQFENDANKFYYNNYLYDAHEILIEIGYHAYDPENNYSIDYIAFFKDYVNLYSRMKPYFLSGKKGALREIYHAGDILRYLENTDIISNSAKKDWYELIFNIYKDLEIIDLEIDDQGYTNYFSFLYDYISSNYYNQYTIGATDKSLTDTFNDISKIVLRKLDKDNSIELIPPNNLIHFKYPLSKSENENLIYLLGFHVNTVAATKYSSAGYFKESKVYLNKSIQFFNKIDLENLGNIAENEYDAAYLIFQLQIVMYDLFYSVIVPSAYDVAAMKSQQIITEYLDDIFSRINGLTELHNLSVEIASKNPEDIIGIISEEFPDTDKFLNNNIVAILRTKDILKKKAFLTEDSNIIEDANDILGKWNPYTSISKDDIDPYDSNSHNQFVQQEINKIYTDLVEKYPEMLSDPDKLISESENNLEIEQQLKIYWDEITSIQREALFSVINNVYLDDIKLNPEIFSSHLSILKNTLTSGVISDIIEINLTKFGLSEQEAEYLLEILISDKINFLFTSEDKNMLLYDYITLDLEDNLARMSYALNTVYSDANANIIYTTFSEGSLNELNSYAIYTITKEIDSTKYNTFRIQKDEGGDSSLDYYTFIYDLRNLSSLIAMKANAENYQKSIYSDLFYSIENQLDKNAFNAIILDPLIQNLPLESLIDTNGNYLFESGLWIRYNSLVDFMKNTQKFRERMLSQEQKLNNVQNFIGLTKDVIDPNILALGGIDYKGKTNNYKVTRGGEALAVLPWTSVEINNINKRFRKSKILSGRNASETFLKTKNLNKYSILHFATHGLSFYENYKNSSILLAPDSSNDGLFSYSEIIKLDLNNVDVVFLSACETNFARPFKNLTSPSIQQAFKIAGASSVISTLWLIEDEASAKFVELYYDEYLKTGFSVYALNNARKKFIEKYPEYNHPYYWAAFAHFGV